MKVMTRITTIAVALAALLALGAANATRVSADLVVWDPADAETSISTLFRLDNGDIGDIDNNVLFEAADFRLQPITRPRPGLGGRFDRGIPAGIRIVSSPTPTVPGPGVFTGTGVATNISGAVRRFAPGELIDGNLNYAADAVFTDSIFGIDFDWVEGDNGYVGLQLSINDQTHYGWAELTLSNAVSSYTLNRFAYETTPNTPIAAAAVPEPSAFLCLTLVGALLTTRRRRYLQRESSSRPLADRSSTAALQPNTRLEVKAMRPCKLLPVAMALLLALPAAGQTFDAELINESNRVEIERFDGTFARAIVEIEAAPQPDLVIDYSTLGDTLLSVTWRAPAGKRIEISPPASSEWMIDGVSLGLDFGRFSFGAGSIQPTGSVTSEDFTSTIGVPPTFFPNPIFTGPGGNNFFAGVGIESLVPGEIYTFTSLTLELTIPASYDVAFDSTFDQYGIEGGLNFSDPDPNAIVPASPGQWIRIVPEPSSFALLGMGGLLFARRRRASGSF